MQHNQNASIQVHTEVSFNNEKARQTQLAREKSGSSIHDFSGTSQSEVLEASRVERQYKDSNYGHRDPSQQSKNVEAAGRGKSLPRMPLIETKMNKRFIDQNHNNPRDASAQRPRAIPHESRVLASPPMKRMGNITEKYGLARVLDEEILLPAPNMLFDESEAEQDESLMRDQHVMYYGGGSSAYPDPSSHFRTDQINDNILSQLWLANQNEAVTTQNQRAANRKDLFEIQLDDQEDLYSNPSQALSPTIAQKQIEIMKELEDMRQKSLNHGGNSLPNYNAISSDKLSYSQTINLNNLKSIENLHSELGVPIKRKSKAQADFEQLQELWVDKSSNELLHKQGYESSQRNQSNLPRIFDDVDAPPSGTERS